MSGVAHVYRYPAASGRVRGTLALATSGGDEAVDAPFLVGQLLQPRATADWLLTVAALGRQRFVTSAKREPPIAPVDPVLTVAGDQVRIEGLSACGSVYARLDCGDEAIAAEQRGCGTASVDVGEGMRVALASVRDGERVLLQVGAAAGAALPPGGAVERRVELPPRWLHGFAEAPVVMAGMERCAEMGGRALLTLLHALPPTRADGWFVPNGRTMRLTPTRGPSGIRIGGAERLRLLEPVLQHAVDLLMFGRYGVATAPFGVALRRPGLQLTVVLSAAPWRGFAVEGGALRDLARPVADDVLARLRAALTWQDTLAAPADADEAAALAWLARTGSAGYSLEEQRWFRRELPLPRTPLRDLPPRHRAAAQLVAAGAVAWQRDVAVVDGGEAKYRVGRAAEGDWTCTCAWFAAGRGAQGPCAHVLAAAMTVEEPAP